MAMFRREKREVPGLNTTSTADISFMLLIFFLVTSSMDTDMGLARQLPPPQNEQQEVEQVVKERNVLRVDLDGNNRLTCNGEPMTTEQLTDRIVLFVANEKNDPALPEKSLREVNLLGLTEVSDRHVLSLQVSRNTSYDAYFQVQNAIVAAYRQVRGQLAEHRFGHPLSRCTPAQLAAVMMVFPQRISEMPPKEEGGEP